jgi:hypothetical protein
VSPVGGSRMSPRVLRAVRAVRRIRRRLTDVPFATVVAALGINNGVTYVLHPGRQPAHQLLPPLDVLWVCLYAAGGLLILAGVTTARANVEAGGCVAYAGGAAVSALANAVVLGFAAWNTVLILAVFAAAALVRAWHLARGRVLVLLDAGTRDDLSRRPW